MKKSLLICIIVILLMNLTLLTACNNSNTSNSSNETSIETPCEHKGMGTCTECDANFSNLFKDFTTNVGLDNLVALQSKSCNVALTYNKDYDCVMVIDEDVEFLLGVNKYTLGLAYNDYDKTWIWMYTVEYTPFENLKELKPYTAEASGTFKQWSSKSLNLPVDEMNNDMRTYKQSVDVLDEIKKYYNILISSTNEKLKNCGYTFTMANLGLEQ